MKIAAGLIGIMLSLLVMVQSCTIRAASSLAGDVATGDAGAVGMIAGLVLFVGGAFAFGLPMVAAWLFGIAGLLALMGAAHFPDLGIWAVIAFGLAAMCFSTWRSIKKKAAAAKDVTVAGSAPAA